jgi:hypothetical protein
MVLASQRMGRGTLTQTYATPSSACAISVPRGTTRVRGGSLYKLYFLFVHRIILSIFLPSYNCAVNQNVSGNYAPVNAFIWTTDIKTGVTLTVNNDRSQGGASIVDGGVEIMVRVRCRWRAWACGALLCLKRRGRRAPH